MSKECLTEFAAQRKKLLENSLLELLNRKSYGDITVSDICNTASIPRRTFYHYFDSKDDVVDSIVDNIMYQCYLNVMFDVSSGIDGMTNVFAQIFSYWQGENRRRLDLLIKNGLEGRLTSHALAWIRTEQMRNLQYRHMDPKLMEIGLMVAVTDFFSLLFYWSRNGYRESPEEMAQYTVMVLPQAFYK